MNRFQIVGKGSAGDTQYCSQHGQKVTRSHTNETIGSLRIWKFISEFLRKPATDQGTTPCDHWELTSRTLWHKSAHALATARLISTSQTQC
ncbi:MAG: hypothetical protein CMM01_10390 [Rhodopirellula sp.]|nr:hypothetical protein [Rhodopirellula sp.]OUX51410.1 MAG: hypothetical protein CBE43_04030 [Rhodopirellula sp. TMED283]